MGPEWRPSLRPRVSSYFGLVLCALLPTARLLSAAAAHSLDDKGTTASTNAPATQLKENPDLLTQARLASDQLYRDLQSFVCAEQINRFRGSTSGGDARAIDTITAKVSFENGNEQYTEIQQNNHVRPGISSIGGAWSEGEFGTLLRQTQILLDTQPVVFGAYTEMGNTPAATYSFDVSEQDSPWDLDIKSREYRIAFHTEVWVSRSTGEILKITRTSTSVPPGMGISELRWSVTLEHADLNGKTWLLPKTGEYEVVYEKMARREWNLMHFSGYRRYGSEVALRFDQRK